MNFNSKTFDKINYKYCIYWTNLKYTICIDNLNLIDKSKEEIKNEYFHFNYPIKNTFKKK